MSNHHILAGPSLTEKKAVIAFSSSVLDKQMIKILIVALRSTLTPASYGDVPPATMAGVTNNSLAGELMFA